MVRYVLSMGGGGTRGSASLYMLLILESFLQLRYKRSINEFFDCFVGTSIGSILALSIVGGLSVPEVYTILKNGFDYFDVSTYDFMQGICCCSKNLNQNQKKILKHTCQPIYERNNLTYGEDKLTLGMYEKPMGFCVNNRDKIYLHSNRHVDDPQILDVSDASIEECFKSSISLPLLFGDNKGDMDGGLGANNPSMHAYIFAKHLYPNEEIRVLFIGTGMGHRQDYLNNMSLCRMCTPINNQFLQLFLLLFHTQENEASYSLHSLSKLLDDFEYYDLNYDMVEAFNANDTNYYTHYKIRNLVFAQLFDNEDFKRFLSHIKADQFLDKLIKVFKYSIPCINQNEFKMKEYIKNGHRSCDGLPLNERITYHYLLMDFKEIQNIIDYELEEMTNVDRINLITWSRSFLFDSKISRKRSFVTKTSMSLPTYSIHKTLVEDVGNSDDQAVIYE